MHLQFPIPFFTVSPNPGTVTPELPVIPDIPGTDVGTVTPEIPVIPDIPGTDVGTVTPELPTLPATGIVRISSGHLNIRNAPLAIAPVVDRAPNGARMTVFGEWRGWYVVNYHGTIGYARSQYIELI